MKITSITLNCRSVTPIKPGSADSAFFLFKAPAVVSAVGTEYHCQPGTAMLFSSGLDHSIRSADRSSLKYDLILLRLSSTDKQYLGTIGMPVDSPVEITDDYVITGLIKCMKEQSVRCKSTVGEFMELTMRALFTAVCDELTIVRRLGDTPEVSHMNELKTLRESLYEYPMNEWNAAECAADIGVSRAYFHRLYFAAFGVTFLSDMIESRLMLASELLETTDLSVSSIAEKCGYENDSYFMRQFKKHRGCTPSDYRRRLDLLRKK